MKKWHQIVLIWFVWSILIIAYMQFASSNILSSSSNGQDYTEWLYYPGRPYLSEPLLNSQVVYDSEYYLSIAVAGYDDSDVEAVFNETGDKSYPMNYAFFPAYPFLMRIVSVPFLFFMNPIAAATLAGVIISLLGTLVGMFALFDLGRDSLGDDMALQAVFLMLVFPTSFFFTVVYSEGLFIALAFSAFALMRRKQWLLATLLIAISTWTRPVGLILVLPLLMTWGFEFYKSQDKGGLLLRLPILFIPFLAYGLWRYFFGEGFDWVQLYRFNNALFSVQNALESWRSALSVENDYPANYFQRFLGLGVSFFALFTCAINWRKYPHFAIFGFFAVLIPLTSGLSGVHSAIRYPLVVPTLWITVVQWSKNKFFALIWIFICGILLALYAYLFAVDMHAG